MAEALHELTATQAAARIRSRDLSPVALVQALLARAEQVDPHVQAWETLDGERALAAARAAEQAVREDTSRLGPLHGVPFGVKDLFDTAGLRTAASFPPYAQRVPAHDAAVVARLKAAGAILLGKTVTTQFAYADPPRTRNPWSAERTPGGSSSGSAAGVAARLVPLAVGSQTAGSVLRPAAYNGVVGLKPTFGRVSKRGAFPVAWTLDHAGVIARDVNDCALFLQVAAGYNPADPYSANQPVPSYAASGEPAPPTLGLLRPGLDAAAAHVRAHLEEVARCFERAGATLREVRWAEPLDLVLAVHHLTMQTEAATVHWQLLEQHPGAHAPRLRAYVEVGRLLPGPLYLHAQRLRRRLAQTADRSLAGLDALLLPTATDVAPPADTTGDPSLQTPASLFGLPAISLPSGLSAERLPYAIQLVAPRWQEPRLLDVARWCQAHLDPLPAPV